MAKLYDTFNNWVENKESFAKATMASAKNTGARNWYAPGSTDSQTSSAMDTADIDRRFNIQDIQDAYLATLKSASPAYDVISMKYQAAHIKACERAFRLRHATPVNLLAHSYNDLLPASNGLYKEVVTSTATDYIETGKAQAKAKGVTEDLS